MRIRAAYLLAIALVGACRPGTPIVSPASLTVEAPPPPAPTGDEDRQASLLEAEPKAGRNAGKVGAVLRMLADLGSDASASKDERQAAYTECINLLDAGVGLGEAEALGEEVAHRKEWAYLAPAVTLKRARFAYHVRDFDKARALLHTIVSAHAQSEFRAPAQELLERLEQRFHVDAKAVGVVLPLSGKYQRYGARALAAIELAFADSGIQLVVKDTEADATVAARAVETLVFEHHVLGIVGPLFSKEALAVALKAEELATPVLSLSHREGLPDIGAHVFRTALTVEAQAQGLARVAFETLGMRRFAFLYPRSRYGEDFTHAFWNEVEKRQGEVRGAESYEHDETTFKYPARKIVGRWFKQARPDYLQGMAELRAKRLPTHRERAAIEKLDSSLPPLVDFDAIVIPDSAETLGLIAPALAFEDIVLERDPEIIERVKKATGRTEVQPVTLLGASTWNNPLTPQRCERYCEGSVFIDAYYADNPDARVREFVAGFTSKEGSDPGLSEALAFDTAALLRKLLAGGATSREALRQALLGAEFVGVTGQLSFAPNGEVRRELFVLTIREGQIRPWEPPPNG